MIHFGISQQHKIILWVRALLAFWQGLSYSLSHSLFRSWCFAQSRLTVWVGIDEEFGEKKPRMEGERNFIERFHVPWTWPAFSSLVVVVTLRSSAFSFLPQLILFFCSIPCLSHKSTLPRLAGAGFCCLQLWNPDREIDAWNVEYNGLGGKKQTAFASEENESTDLPSALLPATELGSGQAGINAGPVRVQKF